jgi:CRP-like cAMP-binding protein
VQQILEVSMERGLSGKTVLLVEDDYFEASELAARLSTLGVSVAGPAANVDQAFKVLRANSRLSGAILDINLGGQMVFPVADELDQRGLPFIFATGYERENIPARHAERTLRKPLDEDAVVTALVRVTRLDAVTPSDATKNALLGRLSLTELHHLSPLLRREHLPQGAILELPGQEVSSIYFPLDCVVSLVVVGREGSRIEAGLIGREGMTGFAIPDGDKKTPFELVNQIEGSALSMSVADFESVMATTPGLRLFAAKFARSLGIQVSHTAMANGRFDIPQRLARWLLMIDDRLLDKHEFRLTHDYLSVMLGVRRSSVTTALHILEGEKLIRSTRSHIRILDRRRLIGFAGEGYGGPEEEYLRLMKSGLGSTQEPTQQLGNQREHRGGVHFGEAYVAPRRRK